MTDAEQRIIEFLSTPITAVRLCCCLERLNRSRRFDREE